MRLGFMLLILGLGLVACKSEKADSVAAPTPLLGTYYYWFDDSVSQDVGVLSIEFKAGNQARFIQSYFPGGNYNAGYYREMLANYSKSGNTYTFTYTAQTCDPVASMSNNIIAANPSDSIDIMIDSEPLNFKNLQAHPHPEPLANGLLTMQEDVGCNQIPEE